MNFHRHSGGRKVVALTPLIDVIFLLVVFFLLTSKFTDLRNLDLLISEGKGENSVNNVSLYNVKILHTGYYSIDDTNYNAKELREYIARKMESGEAVFIVVQPMESVRVQSLVDLLEVLDEQGVENVSIVGANGYEI